MASGQPDYTRQVAVTVVDTADPITVIADVTSPPLNVTFPSSQNVAVQSMPTVANDVTFEDAAFVTGSSPATHNVNGALGRKGRMGYIHNAGSGNLSYQISNDGIAWGGAHTLIAGAKVEFSDIDIHSLKISWIANTAYYIFVA